jgi:hypothetical protein
MALKSMFQDSSPITREHSRNAVLRLTPHLAQEKI